MGGGSVAAEGGGASGGCGGGGWDGGWGGAELGCCERMLSNTSVVYSGRVVQLLGGTAAGFHSTSTERKQQQQQN